MKGKYSNSAIYAYAVVRREWLRARIAPLIRWYPPVHTGSGCTAIIGICSRLPDILIANIRCLASSRWSELKSVIGVFDCEASPSFDILKQQIKREYPELNITFLHYSAIQSQTAERLKLPYVYSWLSWCIAIREVKTTSILIHDYDALIIGKTLKERYERFATGSAKIQGIAWYRSNGVLESDRLATTFEAFVDTSWLRSLRPIDLFNKIRQINGRSVDCDTTLDIQQRTLRPEERVVEIMNQDQLVHPSQMIHQYTMFRRSPGKVLPSFSVVMIPFFFYLAGRQEAIDHANRELAGSAPDETIDLLNDGSQINLTRLNVAQVDWVLKQIVQASVALAISPDKAIYSYGQGLYRFAGATPGQVWRGDFTAQQREWIKSAAGEAQSSSDLA